MSVFTKTGVFALCFLIGLSVQGQEWVEKLNDQSVNFYEVQKEFNNYWDGREVEKGKGWKQFRRYEHFMEQRVYPHGDRSIPSRAMDAYMRNHLRSGKAESKSANANWSLIGPSTAIPSGGGAGRINAVRFQPGNNNIVYACSPAGGLWKSTNGGNGWTTNTDNLTVIGCSDVAIDPLNTNIMYLATGDVDASDTYSIGVLKSTDAGATWNTTGLNWTVTQGRRIAKILIHPTNTDTIYAATSAGIFRSLNGGNNWSQVSTGNFKDMEFKPGDPSVIYAAGNTFRISTNGGTSFSQVTSGLPSSGVTRYAIAVTPANPSYVYLLAGKSSDNGFYGLYRSTNSGVSFSQRSNSPNLMGWSATGSDSGGQAWYDLAIAASPTNANEIFTGGVNIWRSSDGGTSWSIKAHWYGAGSVPYVHADVHDLVYAPGTSNLFTGCDGGVFKTTNAGTSWTDLSDGLQIAQMYRLSTSVTATGTNITGWQDNGTNMSVAGSWYGVYGGDGMECIIDSSATSNVYASIYYGEIVQSTDGGNSFNSFVGSGGTGVDEDGDWVTPYVISSGTSGHIFLVGKTQVYKSLNGGNFSQMGSISGGSGRLKSLAIAPSNSNYVYAAKSNRLWVSTNGSTFTDRTAGLPISSAAITYISIHPTNPLKAWVSFSGYSAANKVFMTSDGGVSWTNVSSGLPNLPVNCLVYQKGSSDLLYAGTDVGVYYMDANSSGWVAYNTNLPNVIVSELEINYQAGKLRAATYGRGLWESPLKSVGPSAPVADFSANSLLACPGTPIQFTDMSTFTPTNWSWSFPGGTPSSSNQQNPVVTYSAAGTYNVTLVATNGLGSGTEVKNSYITVSNGQALPLYQSFASPSFPPADWSVVNPDFSATWERSSSAGGFGLSSTSAFIDNFNNDLSGSPDALVTPNYSIAPGATLALTFDVAYAPYSTVYSDTLRVYVSTDCGSTFTLVYTKGGSTLSTAGAVTSQFTPSASQWRTETVNLSSISNPQTFMVKFENRGGYGNLLYLDNINLSSSSAPPVAAFTTSPAIICQNQPVTFTDQSTNSPTSHSWTFAGGNPGSSSASNPVVTFANSGNAAVSLTAGNASGSDTESSTVLVNPTPSTPTISQSGGNLVSSASAGNQWLLNGSQIPGATGQSHTPLTSGSYTVQVTNAQGCTSQSAAQSVTVGINENHWARNFTIVPNPSTGNFFVSFSLADNESITAEVRDITGRVVFTQVYLAGAGDNRIEVQPGNISAGTYFITLTGNSGTGVKTVIIQ